MRFQIITNIAQGNFWAFVFELCPFYLSRCEDILWDRCSSFCFEKEKYIILKLLKAIMNFQNCPNLFYLMGLSWPIFEIEFSSLHPLSYNTVSVFFNFEDLLKMLINRQTNLFSPIAWNISNTYHIDSRRFSKNLYFISMAVG